MLLLSLLSATLVSIVAEASTATFKIPINPEVTSRGTPNPTLSLPFSVTTTYSQAGVKSGSDGSETTYVLEVQFSHSPDVTQRPPPDTTFTATLVQSSNGFWFSQDTNEGSTSDVQYLTCSLESEQNGNYACVQLNGWGTSTSTASYTNTAVEIVATNVGGVPTGTEGNHARHGIEASPLTAVWQTAVVLLAMMVGGAVAL